MSESDQRTEGSSHEAGDGQGLSVHPVSAGAGVASGMSAQVPSLEAEDESIGFEQLKWPLLGMAVIVGIMLWIFSDFFSRQLRWAIQDQADWGHTLVIPLIAGYFVYLNRKRLLAKPFRTTWIGLVPIILGVAWYVFASIGPQAIRHHNVIGFGVGMTMFGTVLLFFGYRATMVLLFPMAYLYVFGQTISDYFLDLVTFRLQDIAARGSHVILILMGVDVDRSGNVLTVFHNGEPRPLNIAEACSGMRMLMAFLALGVAMAYTMLKHLWQQVVLVIMAFPTAIFVNMLRVVTLALLSLVDADLAAGDFHTFIGLVWLVPAFFIYLGCMWVVTNIVVEENQDDGDDEESTGSASEDDSVAAKGGS